MDLVTNGVVITDAIKFVQQKKEELNQMDSNKTNSSDPKEAKAKEKEKQEILSPDNAALDNTKNNVF